VALCFHPEHLIISVSRPTRFSWTGWHSQPGCARRQLAAEFGAPQALTVRRCHPAQSLAGW